MPHALSYTSIWNEADGSLTALAEPLAREGTEDRDGLRFWSFSVSDKSLESERESENRDGGWMRSLKLLDTTQKRGAAGVGASTPRLKRGWKKHWEGEEEGGAGVEAKSKFFLSVISL